MNIVVEFKTKRNTEKNIMKTQTINYQKVFGKLEQETEIYNIT